MKVMSRFAHLAGECPFVLTDHDTVPATTEVSVKNNPYTSGIEIDMARASTGDPSLKR